MPTYVRVQRRREGTGDSHPSEIAAPQPNMPIAGHRRRRAAGIGSVAAGVAAADVGDSPGLAPELLRCALARTSPQRWPVELDDVGGVNEPVADRVGKRGLPDHVMPDLTGS